MHLVHRLSIGEEILEIFGAKLGDWLLILPALALDSPCWVKLVDSKEVVALTPPPWQRKELPLIHLPAGLLELLGATVGRSEISLAWQEGLRPPEGRRLLLSSVATSSSSSSSYREAALKSFFHVPRTLRLGEVFSVPLHGLSEPLRAIEVAQNPMESRVFPDFEAMEEEEVYQIAPHLGFHEGSAVDPLHGFAFCQLFSFKVEMVEGASESRHGNQSFQINQSAEIILKGSCNARGVPYISSHLFCESPPPILPSLRQPMERLLGILAPVVRSWQLHGCQEAAPSVLSIGPRGCGKRILWHSVCERLGLHLLEVNCSELAGGAGAEARVQELTQDASKLSPCVLCFRRLHALSKAGPSTSPAATLLQHRRVEESLNAALQAVRSRSAHPLVLLAGSCEDLEEIGGPLRQVFRLEMELPRPSEAHRLAVISRFFSATGRDGHSKRHVKDVKDVPNGDGHEAHSLGETMAKLTAGLSYSDVRSVCTEVLMSFPSCALELPAPSDLQDAIEQSVKRLQGGSKVAVTLASKVQWADVGGLQDAKDEIINCITLPLSQGDMFAGQKVRSGVLLFGPPGTGKTLLAKAVATECKVHFLSVKGPELLSMYIGESEKNVRSLFQNARDLAPCVLFFDELDSLAPARGRGSDSGGVMDRVVSQLVTELDTMPATAARRGGVFMVGATNRPDLLDRSLLRPGRLDRMVYLGVASDKRPLLKAISRKFVLASEREGLLECVAEPWWETLSSPKGALMIFEEQCPTNLTGADVSVLCADAYAIAQREHIAQLHELAEGLKVQISSLLLFLDAWEAKPKTSGLVLYGSQQCEAFVLAHHTGTLDRSFRDVSAAVGLLLSQDSAADIAQRASFALAERTLTCPDRLARSCFSMLEALQVRVGQRHFQEALSNLQPSVPMEDLHRYEKLRGEYQNTKA
ncbi:Peroxisomal biogenesis factor 6 (Peroxin-6) [Durusdinium trenchii]|uniref:Peroxisomal biogenesis factor 6 (Peroxin-6) n=1 Tax=Durusdinium trenchii TaxID=1381693 RepID=A0ABP0LXU8_9DINO